MSGVLHKRGLGIYLCLEMRVLIMILILMDFAKKGIHLRKLEDTTLAFPCWSISHCNTTLAVSCRSFPHCKPSLASSCRSFRQCIECVLYICQNGYKCYSCECQTGYQGQHCTEKITFYSSTYGSTRAITSPTISLSTTEAEPSTRSEEATLSPLLDVPKKSAQMSVVAGSIGGIVLIVLTIGLVIFFRERSQRHVSDDTETTYTRYNNDIDSNTAYDTLGAPSADNFPTPSKDSGFGKNDKSMEAEMMDGEYNTLRLHFPVTNETQDNMSNHMDGSLTADSTYSHIPNSKDALFDNTYSHMSNVTNGKSVEPEDKDATDNNLGDSYSSKRKGQTEESRDETYNHAQMNHVRPSADQEDLNDNYSQINLS